VEDDIEIYEENADADGDYELDDHERLTKIIEDEMDSEEELSFDS